LRIIDGVEENAVGLRVVRRDRGADEEERQQWLDRAAPGERRDHQIVERGEHHEQGRGEAELGRRTGGVARSVEEGPVRAEGPEQAAPRTRVSTPAARVKRSALPEGEVMRSDWTGRS
jgi:hypothetical protein